MRALTLVLLCSTAPGFAWGPEGHRLVARLAQDRLTPEAAARVQATLRPGESITSLASWADEVRKTRKETEPWHFINVEITGSGLDMQRDCPVAGCVVSKIEQFRHDWRDTGLSAEQRREALLFLVHFVGDMHQPLHCADDHDKGANEVTVDFEGVRMNLHRLWDSGLLDRMPSEDQLFVTLEKSITPAKAAEWFRGGVEAWAEESFEVARRAIYGELPHNDGGAMPVLGDAYARAAEPVIEVQLEKAAARLAALLNEAQ
jgi:hypothetical protein